MEIGNNEAKLAIAHEVQSLPLVDSNDLTAVEHDDNIESPIARQSIITPTLETDLAVTERSTVDFGSADRHVTECPDPVEVTSCTQEAEETSDDSPSIEGQETVRLAEEAPLHGDNSTQPEPMTKGVLDDNNGEESSNQKLPRRSRRDINVSRSWNVIFPLNKQHQLDVIPNWMLILCLRVLSFCCVGSLKQRIRLQGTAPTFYRRLQVLFSSSVGDGYKSLNSKRLQLTKACSDPPIYVVDNFLTENELTYFHDKIKSIRFEQSFVDNMDYDNYDECNENIDNCSAGNKRQRRTLIDSSHRTSTFFAFGKRQDSKIAALESRLADLFGCWVGQIEALQLVRYTPGQFFGVHHDMGDLLENDQVALPPRDVHVKRRLVTLFVYLNSLEEDQGGCTHFPYCNLRVHPKKGRAVLWSNVTTDGLPDPRTIHAGEPVKPSSASTTSTRRATRSTKPPPKYDSVVKYGLNIWICEE